MMMWMRIEQEVLINSSHWRPAVTAQVDDGAECEQNGLNLKGKSLGQGIGGTREEYEEAG